MVMKRMLYACNARYGITTESMEATVVDRTETNAWILPETGNYRITVDFDAKTVKISH